MRLLLQILSFLVLLMVFVSSGGINKHEHQCRSMESTDISYLPEYFGIHTDCSCGGMLHHHEHTSGVTEISGVGCCKSSIDYFKIPVYQQIFKILQFQSELVDVILPDELDERSSMDDDPLSAGAFYRPPPNALFGKHFIYFTSSIKIPLPYLA